MILLLYILLLYHKFGNHGQECYVIGVFCVSVEMWPWHSGVTVRITS